MSSDESDPFSEQHLPNTTPPRQAPRSLPDIFTRSTRLNRYVPLNTPTRAPVLTPAPLLSFDPSPTHNSSPTRTFDPSPSHTPRAHYTSQSPTRYTNQSPTRYTSQSPTRYNPSPHYLRDSASPTRSPSHYFQETGSPSRSPSRHFTLSRGSGASSEKFLPPPEPIFSPQTFADANSEAADEEDEEGDQDGDTSSDEKNSGESLYSHETAYLGSSYVSTDEVPCELEYFSSSIDGNIMNNINNGYRPKRDKTETKRTVRLASNKSGNLVLENPIPEELKKVLTRVELPFGEFTHMTYTACTLEPDDFVKEGFSLRASKYNRDTEVVVCITMYNEDEFAFARTMHGVMKNVAHLCARHRSSTWGKDSWKKVQVIIVADGRNKVNPLVLQLMTATGCYQNNLARPYVNNKKVTAHLFEYTTQISIDENLKFKGDEKNLTPVQVLFCLKETNLKKINSHRWLFNAFCPVLDPNVVVLLDVGTKPDSRAVYQLWKAFDRDLNVAGAAGEIITMKGKWGRQLLNPLVASQNFEYKMSNILDKPLELVFGYILVLPGALSAYRYIALKNHDDGTGPLALYFKGENLLAEHDLNSSINFFEANMYLAEDRVLCWELVAKRGENWVLKFVKLAQGETDVPDSLPEFLLQRRRWINGALFAALYALVNFRQIWYTRHSWVRKCFLHFEFFYQGWMLVFSFFSLANFYLTFYFLTGSLVETKMGKYSGKWLFTLFNYACICCLTSLFVVSIGNRPQASRTIFKSLVILLTVCATYAFVVALYFVSHTIYLHTLGNTSNYVFFTIVVLILLTYGLYIIMSLLYMDPWHLVTCLLQYFLMIPLYTCTLQIFAFCNTHDVSWGTKGDTNVCEDKLNQYIVEQNDAGEYEAVVVNVDVDEVYLETLYNIRNSRMALGIKTPKAEPVQMEGEDYAKDVRSKVVLVWLLANLVFIMSMLLVYDPGPAANNIYLAVILWLVAALALIRSVGLAAYLVQGMTRRSVETISKWRYRRV